MSSIREPRITVAMPAFNSAEFIGQAIDSVLAQTWTDFELLLVDDGSCDATLAIMRRYESDARVQIVALSENHGRPYVRNRCLELARGEYIAMLDADDWCARDRLARQIAYLEAYPDIAVLGSWSTRADSGGRALPDSGRREPVTADAVCCEMLFQCPIHNPTVLARTAVLRQYGYDADYAHAEDYDLWSRMHTTHRMTNLPVMLTCYRRHATQATDADREAVERDWQGIHARQLATLGVSFTQSDLRYHALLHRGRRHFRERTGRGMDRDYLYWARHWLETLVRANAIEACYPEPMFRRTAGRIWWSVCRKATRDTGMAAWSEFARSWLKYEALGAGVDHLARRTGYGAGAKERDPAAS